MSDDVIMFCVVLQVVVLVMEKLYGENVVRTLSLKSKYNEQQVSYVMRQVRDN